MKNESRDWECIILYFYYFSAQKGIFSLFFKKRFFQFFPTYFKSLETSNKFYHDFENLIYTQKNMES